MKKCSIYLFFFLLPFQHNGYSQVNSKFHLIGKLSSKIDGVIYLSYFNEKKFVTDSLYVQDSVFNFTGFISAPTSGRINIINKGVKVAFNEQYNRIFLEPSEMYLQINLDRPDSINIIGSKTQSEYSTHLEHNKSLFDSIYAAENLLSAVSEKRKKYYIDLINNYNTKIEKNNISFIKQRPNSYVSSFLLYNLIGQIAMEEIIPMFKLLQVSKNDFYYNQIFHGLIGYEKVSVGKIAPDFKSKTLKGTFFSLSDNLKNKEIALIFWTSWCKTCIAEMPDIKRLSAQYNHIKFVLVSDDEDYKEWNNSILVNRLSNFQNIRSLQLNSISDLFKVATLPQIILIGRNKLIKGRYIKVEAFELDLTK